MSAIHPKKERQRIWRDKGDRRRVHARPAGSLCRFAKNRVYRRNLCCIPRAAKTAAVKEIDAARHLVEGDCEAAGAVAPKVIRGPVPMSAFGGKADIEPDPLRCPLLTQSGHWHPTDRLRGFRISVVRQQCDAVKCPLMILGSTHYDVLRSERPIALEYGLSWWNLAPSCPMVSTLVLIRLAKVSMIAALAAYAFIVAYDNIVDYDSNYEFVSHVLSMDTTFPVDAPCNLRQEYLECSLCVDHHHGGIDRLSSRTRHASAA